MRELGIGPTIGEGCELKAQRLAFDQEGDSWEVRIAGLGCSACQEECDITSITEVNFSVEGGQETDIGELAVDVRDYLARGLMVLCPRTGQGGGSQTPEAVQAGQPPLPT